VLPVRSELDVCGGVDVALIICKHGRYTLYRSRDHKTWLLSMIEILTEVIHCLLRTTGVATDLANYISSPEEYIP
jgi:hypothetical protein